VLCGLEVETLRLEFVVALNFDRVELEKFVIFSTMICLLNSSDYCNC
jgi:hypothetical protein